MRFEVPQFIDIEDKIFGPLTWKQFLYLGGGVGMGVVLFLTTNFIVFLLVGLPLLLIALALAFYPVNNRPFSYFLEAMFTYITSNRRYFWRKTNDVIYRDRVPRDSQQPLVASKASADLNSAARKLEMKALEKDN